METSDLGHWRLRERRGTSDACEAIGAIQTGARIEGGALEIRARN